MLSNAKLFSVGDFDFRLQHLLIIGILALSVSASALLRVQPADYGFALNEFDPYFNLRATEFIVDNGYSAYLEWHDDKSWHPFGRDVSTTSQVALHLITATLYNIFGGNTPLYDFVVMFPVIIGSLTSVAVFAFVRVIGGTTAGLVASLMFAISIPIILRGVIGWFKSEPLGLFLAFIGIYLFVSAIKTNKGKTSFIKLIFAGIFIALGLASWGGVQFFLLPLAIFFIALPFFNNDNKFLFWSIPTFSGSLLLTTLLFDRPGIDFVTGYGGFIILLPTIFMILILIVQNFSSVNTKIRNSLILVVGFVATGIGILSAVSLFPSFRYMNAINPFLSATDPLVTSVSEHTTTSLSWSFTYLSVFIIFGLIGAWLLFSNTQRNSNFFIPNHLTAFALIFALVAMYTSSAFIRLELYGSIALIILGSIGFTILLKNVLKKQNIALQIIFCTIIIGLFTAPIILPEDRNWSSMAQMTPSILNGASHYKITTNDWHDATLWIKENTPPDSVIFSWWDYGYWIQTLGERTTLVDNATLSTWQIEKVARTLLSPTEHAWVILTSSPTTDVSEHYVAIPKNPEVTAIGELGMVSGLDADYVLIFLAGTRYETDSIPLYELDGGGDESKKQWFMAVAGLNPFRYLESDGSTPKPIMFETTLLGDLIPFKISSYIHPETQVQYVSYHDGLIPLYVKDIKLDDPNGPLTLVYASPSFSEAEQSRMITILIYKINHDYTP